MAQPGHCSPFGLAAYVNFVNDRVTLSVSSGYDVTEQDVERAESLERHLVSMPFARIDPPRDNKHCICPHYYPEFFS